MTPNTDLLRFDQDALTAELEAAGAQVRGTAVRCPFHEDKSASGSLYQDEGGVWRFKCHAAGCGFCGDVYDVRARRTGQTTAEVLKASHEDRQGLYRENYSTMTPAKKVWSTLAELETSLPKIERRFEYTDKGQVDLIVYRCIGSDGKKTFRQVHPVASGYVMEAPPKPWPIYNRQRVRTADTVIVCEGEKCVHALHDIGLVATTNPGGAGKAEHADWSLLASKTVYLWPDDDAPDPKTGKRTGFVHMEGVAKILATLDPAPVVFWINPEPLELPVKGDVVDYLEGLGIPLPIV